MSRLWIKLMILLCVIFNASCAFIDLRQIGLSIEPAFSGSILPYADSPVILRFDTEMIKKDAEGIMQISSDLGAANGDMTWNGNALHFTPVSGWTAGVRYTLSLTGTVRSVDKRDLRLERYVSFYAVNNNPPPLLESFSPFNGESAGINNIVYEFNFSRSMEKLSVEAALSIDGIGSKTFEWSNEDRKLIVIPDKPLSPWAVYRWSIKDSAKSADGVPLLKTYSGYFKTDLDGTLPHVVKVFPVLNANGVWYPTGADIETGLGTGHGIAVEFNKEMGESALRSVRFEPSLSGRMEFLSDSSVVYIFSKQPEPAMYTMTVLGDTKDASGLKIGSDYIINFTPDIPPLSVITVTAGGIAHNINLLKSSPASGGIMLPVSVDSATGRLDISIHFSLMFNFEEKKNTPQRITLNPFFPRTLPPAALQYISWFSDDRLFMRWEGLSCGDEESPNYYVLTIPGGRGGIKSDQNIYMEEDLILYLLALSSYAAEGRE